MSRLFSALVIVGALSAVCLWGGSAWAISARVGDCVWYDANANGIADPDEHGIDGVAVTLYRQRSDGTFGDKPFDIPAVPNPMQTGPATIYAPTNVFTDPAPDGWYSFPQVPAGTYKIVVTNVPAGYVPTFDLDDGLLDGIGDTPNSAIFVCTGLADKLDVDFGYVEQHDDHYCTFTQGGWGAVPAGHNPGALLRDYFDDVYGSEGLTIGTSPYTLHFSSQPQITAFLPQGGTPAPLRQSWDPPTGKLSVLAGQVVALRLNLDFSNAGYIPGIGVGLGDLFIQEGDYAGQTVGQFYLIAEQALGNPESGLSLSAINYTATMINESFDGGSPMNDFLK